MNLDKFDEEKISCFALLSWKVHHENEHTYLQSVSCHRKIGTSIIKKTSDKETTYKIEFNPLEAHHGWSCFSKDYSKLSGKKDALKLIGELIALESDHQVPKEDKTDE